MLDPFFHLSLTHASAPVHLRVLRPLTHSFLTTHKIELHLLLPPPPIFIHASYLLNGAFSRSGRDDEESREILA